jgi:transcription elongation factor Elf1
LNKEVESTKPADADSVAALSEGVLTFTTPTEFVELPSGGDYYPEGHRLHGEQTVEIKFMTAKEEDILTSKTLIKQGVALERLLKSVIVDKSIDPSTMLTGDRNALLIATRKSGYGEEYNAKINCPSCNNVNEVAYNLDDVETLSPPEESEVKWNSEGNMLVTLPLSKLEVEARLLTGKEEMYLSRLQESKRKKRLLETSMQDVLKSMVISVNGDTSSEVLKLFISRVPARDIKHLREVYKRNTPNVEMNHEFECENCNYRTVLEVPFTIEFFWPR